MLDFRIDTFITVCRYMNYTKAAQELHITQPAVSQHIHYIEKEYGVGLFEFRGKKMHITEEGQQLLDAFTTMKHDDMALRRTLKEQRAGRHRIIFGTTMTIGEFVIGEYLARYMQSRPDTEISLTIANTGELLGQLNSGELDFALVEGYFEKKDYDFRVFRKERYIGVCGKGHSVIREGKLELYSLLGYTLISREKGSGTREVLDRAMRAMGYETEDFANIVEISHISTIKMMLEHGNGISFLYEAAVKKELEEGKLKQIEIEGFPLFHDFTFIWRKNSMFAEEYQRVLAEIMV